ncbi:hypothetical protein QUB56_16975, partial [Microcoleus sp. AR_TQ3_B6]|uniref:hypothetical protein n=1 Tax=Microcoleus sp. AR_TQ3_B6 TaxID=3055284 RepID=UPI002FD7450F
AIDKKNPAKIGRELINQGASTNLISRKRAPLSGHFGRIWQNLWRTRAIDKKNPAKIGRELINQGASTKVISIPEYPQYDCSRSVSLALRAGCPQRNR